MSKRYNSYISLTAAILAVFTIQALGFAELSAQSINLDSDYRSISYPILERLFNLSRPGEIFENVRPYSLADVDSYLRNTASSDSGRIESASGLARIIRFNAQLRIPSKVPWIRFDLASSADVREGSALKSYEFINGHLDWIPNKRFIASVSFTFSEELAEDPAFGGKVWKGIAGRLNYAYLQYKFDFLKLTFGRDKNSWGPGRRSNLLISGNSDGMDMIRAEAELGPFKFTTFTAVLDPDHTYIAYGDSLVKTRINRYLAAHRLDIQPMSELNIGLSESVIYGGIGRQIEFYYTNPITWYHGEQLNQNNDDNTFLSLDVTYRPIRGVKLYGEFLIDDFQIDNETKGDDEPNELGFIGGFFLSDPMRLRNTDISFEYARVSNWTYNQGVTWNRYIQNEKLIGHYLGPDSESIYFGVRHWLKSVAMITVSFERLNAGEGSVFDDWTTPWLFSIGKYSEPFPTGTVEKRNIFGISGEYFGSRCFRVGFDGYYLDIANSGNIRGESDSFFEGRLTITATTGAL